MVQDCAENIPSRTESGYTFDSVLQLFVAAYYSMCDGGAVTLINML